MSYSISYSCFLFPSKNTPRPAQLGTPERRAQLKCRPRSPSFATKPVFSNDDGTMSLSPTLLNLVDQAKDALWAVTACIIKLYSTHQQRSRSTEELVRTHSNFFCLLPPLSSEARVSFLPRFVLPCGCPHVSRV